MGRVVGDSEDAGEADEIGPVDVLSALEVACQELGYEADFIVEFLEKGAYPQELLARIMATPSCQGVDRSSIFDMLEVQKSVFLSRLRRLIEVRQKQKSEEEAVCQQKLQMMGRCPMDFEWLKEEGGWRCAGGTHWVSDEDVKQFMI